MLTSLGWHLEPVPLFVHIVHPGRVARGIRHLRGTLSRRLALDLAAFTGVAWAGARAAQVRVPRPRGHATATEICRFHASADLVWASSRLQHALVAVRDADALNAMYRGDAKRFIRIEVRDQRRPIGWAVVLDTQMSDHQHFGNLRVGSIIDCLAPAAAACIVTAHARRFLADRGVDLIVSNQSARCWRDALKAEGFLERPSNFLFGASSSLGQHLSTRTSTLADFHLNRGDGDGPIHL
jgi:hypothetical protein